jgi:hypothetical protein
MDDSLQVRFETLTLAIRDAIDDVEHDGVARIADLEHKVSALCEDLKKADEDTVHSLKGPLAQMISSLDELAHSITQYQNRTRDTH